MRTRIAGRLGTVWCAGAALLVTTPAAGAGWELIDEGVDDGGRVEAIIETDPVEELVAKAEARSGRRWVPVPTVGFVQDDLEVGIVTVCRDTGWAELLPGDDPERTAAEAEAAYLDARNAAFIERRGSSEADLPCPYDLARGMPAAAVEEALRRAAVAQLPRPRPEIPPGVALTGLPAFLVTGHSLGFGPVTRTLDLGVAAPTVTFAGVGTSTVMWGDGAITTHDVPGLPHPTGEVTHTYIDRGTYTVQVIDTWRITYDVDGVISGVLEATLDAVTLDGFPVEEYQAVRTRVER